MRDYEAVRPLLKTGDLVLFAGRGGVSAWIRWFTRSPWTHIGMVVRQEPMDSLFVWESTTLSTAKDVSSGALRRGVQLAGLRERILAYDGEIAVRRLSRGLGRRRLARLGVLRNQFAGRPYEESKLELLKAAADILLPENREDLTSLFCSELVAEAYQTMGLLDERKPSNEYVPGDFAADRLPRLRGGFVLGAEEMVGP
ncbi:MAG: hypothetical protein KDG89_18480 [Geminicoccaceae bacterium]|nr:hypothetical protein [Geminicoccaceae bacterium]